MIDLEKFQKDIITTENIIADYKIIFLKIIKLCVLTIIVLIPILCLLIYFIITQHLLYKLILGFPLFLTLIGLYGGVKALLRENKSFRNIINQKFKIVMDILNNKDSYTVGKMFCDSPIRILHFNEHKEFVVSEYLELRSAKSFNFDQTEFFNTSKIEDKFYLVLDSKNNILLAYNTKFFELKIDT